MRAVVVRRPISPTSILAFVSSHFRHHNHLPDLQHSFGFVNFPTWTQQRRSDGTRRCRSYHEHEPSITKACESLQHSTILYSSRFIPFPFQISSHRFTDCASYAFLSINTFCKSDHLQSSRLLFHRLVTARTTSAFITTFITRSNTLR